MQEKETSTSEDVANDKVKKVENVDAPKGLHVSSSEPTSEQKDAPCDVKKEVDGYSSKAVNTESDSGQQLVLSRKKSPISSPIFEDMAKLSLAPSKETKGKEMQYKMLELRHKELDYSNEENIRASKLKQMELEVRREELEFKREEMGLQKQENEFALIRSLVDKNFSAAEIEGFLRCTR
jgi:hypothetical protein